MPKRGQELWDVAQGHFAPRRMAVLCRVVVLLLLGPAALGAQIQLAWDPPTVREDGSPLTDLAGYRVYFGTSSGSYTETVNVGPTNAAVIGNLADGVTYYFAVAAYDSADLESSLSGELAWNSLDQEVDGLPDAWEIIVFGDTSVSGGAGEDCDGDGQCDLTEYISGTSPTNSACHTGLTIGMEQGRIVVQFAAVKAEGPGYENRRRLYTVDRCPDAKSAWAPCPGLEAIEGSNQVVSAEMTADAAGMFRIRCWLEDSPP